LRGDEHLAIGEAHPAIRRKQHDVCRVIGGLPKQLAIARVQGKNTIMRRRQVHDAVPHKRSSLLLAIISNVGPPGQAKSADVGLVDLSQGDVTVSRVRLGGQNPVGIIALRAEQSVGTRKA
jgi:hypothetical protein